MAETRVRIPVAVLDSPRTYGAFRVLRAGMKPGMKSWLILVRSTSVEKRRPTDLLASSDRPARLPQLCRNAQDAEAVSKSRSRPARRLR